MNEPRPPFPSGSSPAADWFQKAHQVGFGARRILPAPGALVTQTPSGVYHRPKAIEETTEGPIKHFAFTAKWVFPEGITSASLGRLKTAVPKSRVDLAYNVSAASDAEYGQIFNDLGGQNYAIPNDWVNTSAGYHFALKLLLPIPDGWAIDLTYGSAYNHQFAVSIANIPESGRRVSGSRIDGYPPRRFYSTSDLSEGDTSTFRSSRLFGARYFPTPGSNPGATFVCAGPIASIRNAGWDTLEQTQGPEYVESLFGAGYWFAVTGHAFDRSEVPNVWGEYGW